MGIHQAGNQGHQKDKKNTVQHAVAFMFYQPWSVSQTNAKRTDTHYQAKIKSVKLVKNYRR